MNEIEKCQKKMVEMRQWEYFKAANQYFQIVVYGISFSYSTVLCDWSVYLYTNLKYLHTFKFNTSVKTTQERALHHIVYISFSTFFFVLSFWGEFIAPFYQWLYAFDCTSLCDYYDIDRVDGFRNRLSLSLSRSLAISPSLFFFLFWSIS